MEISIFLLVLGGALSFVFDAIYLLQIWPQVFTHYELYLFDMEQGKNIAPGTWAEIAINDLFFHFGIANMIFHSAVFMILAILWRKQKNLKTLSVLFLIFIYAFATKAFYYSITVDNARMLALLYGSVLISSVGLLLWTRDVIRLNWRKG